MAGIRFPGKGICSSFHAIWEMEFQDKRAGFRQSPFLDSVSEDRENASHSDQTSFPLTKTGKNRVVSAMEKIPSADPYTKNVEWSEGGK